MIGAFAPAALRRVARYGDGFLWAAPLDWAGQLVSAVCEHWDIAKRVGRPRVVCQVNVAVGSRDVIETARGAIDHYYAFAGRPLALSCPT